MGIIESCIEQIDTLNNKVEQLERIMGQYQDRRVKQQCARQGDIANMVGLKKVTHILKEYREFVVLRPNYYKDFEPLWLGESINSYYYRLVPVLHFIENRKLLSSGSKSVKFEPQKVRERWGL